MFIAVVAHAQNQTSLASARGGVFALWALVRYKLVVARQWRMMLFFCSGSHFVIRTWPTWIRQRTTSPSCTESIRITGRSMPRLSREVKKVLRYSNCDECFCSMYVYVWCASVCMSVSVCMSELAPYLAWCLTLSHVLIHVFPRESLVH